MDILYNVINTAIVRLTGTEGVPLGVGPILFGVFYTGFDLLFIRMKALFGQILKEAKEKAKNK